MPDGSWCPFWCHLLNQPPSCLPLLPDDDDHLDDHGGHGHHHEDYSLLLFSYPLRLDHHHCARRSCRTINHENVKNSIIFIGTQFTTVPNSFIIESSCIFFSVFLSFVIIRNHVTGLIPHRRQQSM